MEPQVNQGPLEQFDIRLMDGEKIIIYAKPARGLITYWIIICCVTCVGIVILPLLLPLWFAAIKRRHYWLTNKRVICCYGIIGYQVKSLPLERVADVTISRSLLEQIAGISSVIIKDMSAGGQAGYDPGSCWGAVGDASVVQQQILSEVKKVNEQRGKI